MKRWILGAICAVMICAPVQGAVRIYEGVGIGYFFDVSTGWQPESEAITAYFKATVDLDEFGQVKISSYMGGPIGTYELRNSEGFLLQSEANTGDNRPFFNLGDEGRSFTFGTPYLDQSAYHGYGTITAVNGQAVPEPSTWAMLILGFGLLGGVMRQRTYVLA